MGCHWIISGQEKDAELVDRLGLKGKFVVGYIGTHGMAHGLDFILDAIKGLEKSHPDLLFLFVGDGAEKGQIACDKRRNSELSNALFLDSVRNPRYTNTSDYRTLPRST